MQLVGGLEYYTATEVAKDLGITPQGWYKKLNAALESHPDWDEYPYIIPTNINRADGKKLRLYCEKLFDLLDLPVGKRSPQRTISDYIDTLEKVGKELDDEKAKSKALNEENENLRQQLEQSKKLIDALQSNNYIGNAAEYEEMREELVQLRERTKSQQETIDRLTADAQKMSDTITQLTQSNTTLSSANYLATLNNKRIDAAFRSLSATPLMSRLFGWNAAVQTAALLTQDIIETASESENQ